MLSPPPVSVAPVSVVPVSVAPVSVVAGVRAALALPPISYAMMTGF